MLFLFFLCLICSCFFTLFTCLVTLPPSCDGPMRIKAYQPTASFFLNNPHTILQLSFFYFFPNFGIVGKCGKVLQWSFSFCFFCFVMEGKRNYFFVCVLHQFYLCIYILCTHLLIFLYKIYLVLQFPLFFAVRQAYERQNLSAECLRHLQLSLHAPFCNFHSSTFSTIMTIEPEKQTCN